jgi:cation diffusion facilitator family transporter
MDRNAPDHMPADAPFCPVHHPDFIPHPDHAEQAVSRVLWLSALAMVAEIVTGYLSGSMALLADGWHMGTHVAAMAISAFAYTYMRAHRGSARYSFGPGKVSYLAGYSSSLLLAGAALFMIVESVARLRAPHAIHYDEALLVALVGLAVNLISAWLLHDKGGHAHHAHAHEHDHGHHHGKHDDHNLRAAYLHVVADALTSIAAIGALVAGKWAGLAWLDPLVAALGGLLILRWAWQLARDSATVLLDRQVEGSVFDAVLGHVDEWGGRPLDVHLWLLAPGRHALALTVAASPLLDPEALRARLAGEKTLAHVTLDLRVIDDASGAAQQSL